jgi:cytochrome c553
VLARVLHLFGKFPLFPAEHIDHRPRSREVPPARISLEFGGYLARMCRGCHGEDFAGGPPMAPGTPPVSNLTPAALADWSEADFRRALREGKRPDGSDIDRFMPWESTRHLTDTELGALWMYISALPPRTSSP